MNNAPSFAKIAESIAASVMLFFAKVAEHATFARAGQEISAITAIYAAIARSCA